MNLMKHFLSETKILSTVCRFFKYYEIFNSKDFGHSYSNRYAFNGQFICTTYDPKISFLTPFSTPTVLNYPVFHSRCLINAIAHDNHSVVGNFKWIELVF